MTEEIRILQGLREGDPGQFQALMDKYDRYAAAIAAKVAAGNLPAQDLEEIVADVFVAIWKAAANIDPSGRTLKSYIGITARNQTISALRKKRHPADTELADDMIALPSTEECYLDQEGARQLGELVGSLPEPDREIFIRRYFYREKVMDIAEQLEMNDNAVSARIARMKQRLQERCQKEGVLG